MSFWHHFTGLERVCGGDGAIWLARRSAEAVAEIGAVCEAEGIDAHFRHDGWLWTATNAAQLGAWESTIAAIERHGETPFAPVEHDDLVRRSGSDRHLAGVFEATLGDAPAGAARARAAAGRARARDRGLRALADAVARALATAGRAHARAGRCARSAS